jgi:hypothetical protein
MLRNLVSQLLILRFCYVWDYQLVCFVVGCSVPFILVRLTEERLVEILGSFTIVICQHGVSWNSTGNPRDLTKKCCCLCSCLVYFVSWGFWRAEFDPRSGHVGFVVDRIALRQVFSEFSLPVPTSTQASFIYLCFQRRLVEWATALSLAPYFRIMKKVIFLWTCFNLYAWNITSSNIISLSQMQLIINSVIPSHFLSGLQFRRWGRIWSEYLPCRQRSPDCKFIEKVIYSEKNSDSFLL